MENEEIEKKFNELEQRIKTHDDLIKSNQKLITSLMSKLKSVSTIYTNIQTIQKDNLKTLQNRMALNETRKLQAENLRKSILPKVIKAVIDVVCKTNNNLFENLFVEKNQTVNQITRHEINYCLSYFFNPRFKEGVYISEANVNLCSTSIGLITGRDHATVLYSCITVLNDLKTNKKYKAHIDVMLAKCLVEITESLKKEEK